MEKVENTDDVFGGNLAGMKQSKEEKDNMKKKEENMEEKMCEKGDDLMDKANAELDEAKKATDDNTDDLQVHIF